MLLRLLLRSPFRLLIGVHRPCPTDLRLLHDRVPETLKPSVSDVTVPYLIESCGLSPTEAHIVAKKITLKNTVRADSFLSLLNAHGFTQRQIVFVITGCPQLLTFDQEKKTIPKLDFFVNVCCLGADLGKVISMRPQLLCRSLEKSLVPNFRRLSDLLGSERDAAVSIGKSPRILEIRLDKILVPNMKTLLDIGVPQPNVLKVATYFPRALMNYPSHFNKAVGWLKEIGFDPSEPSYMKGLDTIYILSPSSWKKKLELYRSLGWSERTILTAFRKYPSCMAFSEEKIMKSMSFFLEKMKCEPSYISARPFLLYYSFDNRIAPRYKIFCLLKSKRLTELNMNFLSLLPISNKVFTDKYVTKYVEQIPDLLEVFMDRSQSCVLT